MKGWGSQLKLAFWPLPRTVATLLLHQWSLSRTTKTASQSLHLDLDVVSGPQKSTDLTDSQADELAAADDVPPTASGAGLLAASSDSCNPTPSSLIAIHDVEGEDDSLRLSHSRRRKVPSSPTNLSEIISDDDTLTRPARRVRSDNITNLEGDQEGSQMVDIHSQLGWSLVPSPHHTLTSS